MEDKVDKIENSVGHLETRLSELEHMVNHLEEKTGVLENTAKEMHEKITDIRLTLENETNKHIRIVAEGHLDLSRKLDEALRIENEKEILLLRVTHLENEVRRIRNA